MKKLFFFSVAGSIGFIVDVAVLHFVLRYTSFGPYFGRALAIAAANACTWYFNRRFTFDASGRSLAAEGARYGSVGVTSAGINFGSYSLMLLAIPTISPYIALILASSSAMAFSYMGYSRFVFASVSAESDRSAAYRALRRRADPGE
ncbi:GtrA family protein [Pseudohoeflea coraliihabitans]|uniref:GtrA family protein n=1 Tax=Pseudohoeflea coraliihabitans TaxID=2860393 RepID=A0ABS6WRL5_9HYPH|nr:GtrA family protein [Pseudohoeflea sp. DP4N28-3]MBW3097679.1 GtrA family protein [Pseudohoeflea sp. DP4N28-3]